MPTNLATDVDLTYADDVTVPSRKKHQQDHDILHTAANALSDPTAPDTYGARAYVDQKVAVVQAAFNGLPPLATSGSALDVVGGPIEFLWNVAAGEYRLAANPTAVATRVALVGAKRKRFFGPAAQHPKNITTIGGTAVTPIFTAYDEFQKVN